MNKQKVYGVTTEKGLDLIIRRVDAGDSYGLNNCLTHERADDPLIEFYDSRYSHCEYGQFIAHYYLSTLLTGRAYGQGQGLNLHGGVPDWEIDGASLARALKVLKQGIECRPCPLAAYGRG